MPRVRPQQSTCHVAIRRGIDEGCVVRGDRALGGKRRAAEGRVVCRTCEERRSGGAGTTHRARSCGQLEEALDHLRALALLLVLDEDERVRPGLLPYPADPVLQFLVGEFLAAQ